MQLLRLVPAVLCYGVLLANAALFYYNDERVKCVVNLPMPHSPTEPLTAEDMEGVLPVQFERLHLDSVAPRQFLCLPLEYIQRITAAQLSELLGKNAEFRKFLAKWMGGKVSTQGCPFSAGLGEAKHVLLGRIGELIRGEQYRPEELAAMVRSAIEAKLLPYLDPIVVTSQPFELTVEQFAEMVQMPAEVFASRQNEGQGLQPIIYSKRLQKALTGHNISQISQYLEGLDEGLLSPRALQVLRTFTVHRLTNVQNILASLADAAEETESVRALRQRLLPTVVDMLERL